MTGLTTHILDTARGCPAAGIRVTLHRVAAARLPLAEAVTDGDGRAMLVADDDPVLASGVYDLMFAMGAYFEADQSPPGFIGEIVLRIGIDGGQAHYHVPLLVSPWSYTTYRGR